MWWVCEVPDAIALHSATHSGTASMRPNFAVICLLAVAAMNGGPTDAGVATAPAVTLNGHRIGVEIATDDASRTHGLMDRTSMPADHGMLFVFPDDAARTFWMKDTLIPLDMLFLDADRRVVTVRVNARPCTADPCTLYSSTEPARYVLELNAGVASELGVREGDIAVFSNVPPATQ